MEIKFKRNFKLVDNGNLTQNLHSLCYQNNILISEIDLGNVEDILVQLKKQKEIIDKVKSAIKTNCIKIDEKYVDICCSGDYLLQILEDKEV